MPRGSGLYQLCAFLNCSGLTPSSIVFNGVTLIVLAGQKSCTLFWRSLFDPFSVQAEPQVTLILK